MNRRSFFSLAGLGALAALFKPMPRRSILDLEPLDLGQLKPLTPQEKLQAQMISDFDAWAQKYQHLMPSSQSHTIYDPGHYCERRPIRLL
jgi:hypothetical protein